MAELVIAGLLVGVGKHIICFVDLLHFLLTFLVVGVKVGVIFLDARSVRLFYFIIGSALLNAKHFIKISFICHKILPFRRSRRQLCHFVIRNNPLQALPVGDCAACRSG